MENKNSQSERQRRSFSVAFILIFGGFFLISIIWSLYNHAWSGFQGKTLWDWLDLFLVPILLILLLPGAHWMVQKAQERHALMEREIALDDHREKALQSYMELMTDLIFEKGLGSREDHHE
jgi:hypothetical protein